MGRSRVMAAKEEENMAARIGGWVLYFALVAGLIFIGWHEPLRYRFLSRADIYAIEHPAPPSTPTPAPKPVTPKPGAWMNEPTRTALDGSGNDGKHSANRLPPVPAR